jgi:hypothetical protein
LQQEAEKRQRDEDARISEINNAKQEMFARPPT